ncbi:uncharacterized protein G2W53_000474 [Senna tora]|uniref:Uncharacterized protein n=1 Tax=Senna tora TaxID=362788 RepID=A0A835CIH9_9FABA|nr:uncharacterized protein G2W53_000474 [Senna tora]
MEFSIVYLSRPSREEGRKTPMIRMPRDFRSPTSSPGGEYFVQGFLVRNAAFLLNLTHVHGEEGSLLTSKSQRLVGLQMLDWAGRPQQNLDEESNGRFGDQIIPQLVQKVAYCNTVPLGGRNLLQISEQRGFHVG